MNEQLPATLLDASLWTGKLFSGEWRLGTAEANIVEPATGGSLGRIGMADAGLIGEAAAIARQAQVEWSALHHEERAAIIRRAARLAEHYFDEIVGWLIRESGSTQGKAAFEASVNSRLLHECTGLPSRSAGEVLPSVPGRLSLARRRPLGVVGVISPFNFPLCLAMRAVAPALALGNAVVLKPDPRTAVCGGFVVARLFELAGLPAGVLHVLPGDGAAGAALTADPNVAMIQFTGSTAAGRKVGEAAGRHLKKVSLELGGKNSLIVLDDADLDIAVANTAWGAYLHQGQICMASGRVLVQRSLYPRFVEKLVEKVKGMAVGDPATGNVHIGPLINAVQRDHAAKVVADARQAGARLEVGGNYRDLFFEPTVLSEVTPDNPAFNEEIFGPVAVVTPFDSDDDAVELANRTEYGLSMAVISKDVGRALRIGERLRTGMLHINDQTVNDEVINPFGGFGASGNGTSIGGPANLEEFTQWQWVTVKSEAPLYPF
ncbi:benzaldehyde dehydrogenase (plasmid) [Pseudomonas putida S12]|uniref:Benzaldehyde dehydrogenase n=1 Tax=Pseudomonas putida S12 TaxID=1215087 RepID=A0AA34S0X8_PSEPU|nr:benzaldehyde dehydrogenase [Pseudomonas putida]AJA17119.1 benzaldehyde dehydrogenase [Pseudomonas putida S12]PJX08516.1 benzaldehyde dehydrogenase [Pseudomonas putida]